MDCDVFAVNTNGWIVVGSSSLMLTIGGSTGNSTPISTTGPSGFKNAIVPVGMNLQGQSGSELSYLLDGVAPYRVLIIQWRSYRAAGASGENYNFQIKLFETTNEIAFAFGVFTKNSTSQAPQVGLRGDDNTDFHNRTTDQTGSWSSTTQGTVNTQYCLLTPLVYPSNGLVFRFTPYYDFGDAPNTYMTLLANNGARHTNTGLKLGNLIDTEANGFPSANAQGDDSNNLDDEDGVWWTCNFVPGRPSQIQVTASAAGLLNAWFDWNLDGDWADPGEQVFTNTPLVAGVNNLAVAVPAGTPTGQTFARFRFSTQANLSYTGAAVNGEVEDYQISIEPAIPMDYGDAPDPSYNTLAASDGARHVVDPAIFLGNLVDTELDGQPNLLANGDIPDEDGVVFNTPLIPGGPATITVTASIGGAFLQGWIDYNGDGDWMDPGEQIFTNAILAAGPQNLAFNIPATATAQQTYARFRFSTMANLQPFGCAPNGEVEDYRIYIGEYDFGDAPDPTYPTLLVSNGAIHKKSALFLGSLIDAEPDGQPNGTATGDDNNPAGADDEDGVWWGCNFVPGQANTVKVTATGAGKLNAWFDWNKDGDWADPGEQVFTNVSLAAGTTDLVVTPPASAVVGTTFARFRFNSTGNLSYTGMATDGEVEDYSIVVEQPEVMDYGDAPDPGYPTLATSNGARHANQPNNPIFLGNLIDWEINGQPNANATGDDLNNMQDEDGILFTTALVPGQVATIQVTASIGGGAFQGWIDFNADGDWADPGEQIFSNVILAAGPQLLNFVVPAGTSNGSTYARFRYSTMGNLTFYGCAPNGEVEDYKVTITTPLEFGDAPAPYPTLLANNGARHVNTGLRMGTQIDVEPDGLPNATATGDDLNNLDDEDGIWWGCDFVPGQVNTISVTVNGAGFLNAWFDWNSDGDWADAGEQVFTNIALPAGPTDLVVHVPVGATLGTTFARFRFSTQQGLNFIGLAPNGEVEDYSILVRQPEEMDYGDAPDPTYPTLASSNGARHAQVPGTNPLFLGNLIDYEMNGQPHAKARGDDLSNLADEDGVVFTTPVAPGSVATVTVTASAGGGLLQGWIDFNQDGDWNDVGEQIFTNQLLVAGPQPLAFNVPAGATIGNTYARFRYSTMANLKPYGCAPNGEVEDYMIYIGAMDFGDAPDPTYPTVLVNDGARHQVDGVTYLGIQEDIEIDGLPSTNATGDDNSNLDDEDGVTFLWPLIPGSPCKLKVVASVGTALLNVWIDFNRNGSWADAGEQVFTDFNPVAGTNFLTFIVPVGAVPGPTCARFRFSHQPGLSYTGYAYDGEVEDYSVDISTPGDIKWLQSYETSLPGLHSDQTAFIADDWICSGGLVTDLHWWGNYELDLNGQEERGMGIHHFMINIYSNANCLPGTLLKTYNIPFSSITEVNTGSLNSEMCPIYYYEVVLPEPFTQLQGMTYWLSIVAISVNPTPPFNAAWRWQEANRWFQAINCSAASSTPTAPWMSIFWQFPLPGQYSDMAFVITSQFEPYDYGDAPDLPYPTMLGNNGARHQPSNLQMGALIDYELNGQPDPNALGDDNNNLPDEDGVTWPCQFIVGMVNPVTVTVNGTGFLNAWFDFNGDGTWADPGEHALTDVALSAGSTTLGVVVPPGSIVGTTFARFRFSSIQGLSYTGLAPDGEVEDYSVTLNYDWPMDFGDAPDPAYPTLLASDGARHNQPMFGINPILGNQIDYEMNGQPVPPGLGDDNNNLADEDGVIIPVLNPGTGATLQVTSNIGGSYFQAWIDFNADGDWSDPGEQIFSNVMLVGGSQPLTFMVPPNAATGNTYARFRYSSVINLSYTGCAPDGEVEDYPVLIQPVIEPMDYGDAPDPTYPTLLGSNGARHQNTGLMMGWLIDVEPDGQPSNCACADDTIPMGWDDEDGVWWPCNFMPGQVNTVQVTVNGPGFLNAWFDWNKDGDWSDPGEQVFTDVPLLAGTTDLFVPVPAGAVTDTTYARFRFSTQTGLSYTGPAQDGEVEDYQIIVQPVEPMDYGDAPDPGYPTLAASNGARHMNFPFMPVWLGNIVDWELDGQPTPNANGDDLNNAPDEDGVVLLTPLIPGGPAAVQVTASIGGGALQAWIDFNHDGDWSDPGEQVFTNTVLIAGPQILNFLVPLGAIPGNTYARFRYSTMGNLAPYGCAPNGEVEDYLWCVGEVDFGDAPDPSYPTLLIHDGARHLIDHQTFLGGVPDAEPNGQPTFGAVGDDSNGLDDEDGVTFLWTLAKGQPCKIRVIASVGNALFNLWIDYNGNGSWAEPNEHVFVDLNLQAGINYLTFIVPRSATQGISYARARFSHQPALSFTGYAFDGEVEDYFADITKYLQVKWLQPFDPQFPGVHTNQTIKLADDWRCNGGLVTDVHWWGNYELNDQGMEKRGAGISHFILKIHKNSNCLPGTVLRTYYIPFTSIPETYTGMSNVEGSPIYEYDFNLPQYFIQIKDSLYWISLQAMPNDPQNPPAWRWQEANRWFFPILCGGAIDQGSGWQTITWPTGSSMVKYSDFAFRLTTSVVDSLALQNLTITPGQNLCFDATGVITLAGGGTNFIVQPGGSVILIAGQKIRFLPGVQAMSGSYLHGYITTTGQFCSSLEAPLVTGVAPGTEVNEPAEATKAGTRFIAYPNPTAGGLTVEMTGDKTAVAATVEVFDMMGEKVISHAFPPQMKYEISLASQPTGIYVLRVITGMETVTVKVIKQ